MEIVRKSPVTGKFNIREVNVTKEQLERWYQGELIQTVMPDLTPSEREFLISGATDEDWEDLFGGEEEEDFDSEPIYPYGSFPGEN